MADVEINALPAAAALTGAEILPADQGPTTVRLTVQEIIDAIPAQQFPMHDMNIAGAPTADPTDAECRTAAAALGIGLTANAEFFIHDTSGDSLVKVVYVQATDTFFVDRKDKAV